MQFINDSWTSDNLECGDYIKCRNQKDLEKMQKKLYEEGVITTNPVNCFGTPGIWLRVEARYVLSENKR